MRLGVIADVHANLPALRRALSALREAGAERIVCLGDLVGYGAEPDACVEEVLAAGATCVAGNHDLIAIEGACVAPAPLAAGTVAALAALPLRAVLPGGVVAAHGSLTDPCAYVEDVRSAA